LPTEGCVHCSLGKGRDRRGAGVYLAASKSESARPGWTVAARPAAKGFLVFCFINLFRVYVTRRHRIDAFACRDRLEAANLTRAFLGHYK